MNENQKDEETIEEDDLQTYIREMEHLESDFSDLDDLDLEEIQEMQDAIAKVREEEEQIDNGEIHEIEPKIEEEIELKPSAEISEELEERIKQELLRKKEAEEKEQITPDKFLAYINSKREKIWYHALWYLVFDVEDNIASKALLYDVLKEITSKSAIDPIPENQFYFGLGFILRLSLNGKKIIRYLHGGKFKININIGILQEILEKAGEPINTRPIIEEKEKKTMYKDFLKDDFLDI